MKIKQHSFANLRKIQKDFLLSQISESEYKKAVMTKAFLNSFYFLVVLAIVVFIISLVQNNPYRFSSYTPLLLLSTWVFFGIYFLISENLIRKKTLAIKNDPNNETLIKEFLNQ